VASRLLGRFAQLSRQAAPTYGLSDRELEVLRLIAKGASNKMIAGSLHISESTAKNHVANVFRKLDVSDRTEAVTLALQKGIIGL
jgi:DNA-binding NarL/FixJ family response regulator